MSRCSLTFALMALLVARFNVNAQNAEFDDHQNMLDQLGIKSLRPGANPNDQSTFSETTANPYAHTMPPLMVMKDGSPVTAANWNARREEMLEDFAREVYGRIPDNVPAVTWEVIETTRGQSEGIATLTRKLLGKVDNSTYPAITVNIEATITVPADARIAVPMMIEFDGFGRRPTSNPSTNATTRPAATQAASRPARVNWRAIAISKGWGHASLIPQSIQPDNNQLTTAGIIALTNRGRPRTPEQWGALRAWQWGASRLLDCIEAHPDWSVDAKKVGIAGLSRYGKAAIVTQAFDSRFAVGLIGSSGQGGTKLHRHIFGEAVENLAGGLYYWMAGNYIKYAAADPPKTAADLPVDSHQLIALCAPRPCFISHGIVEKGDAKWIDARGSFMAAVLASPAYELLGAKGLGTTGNYLTDEMPTVGTLIGGQLAWRQHDGGHEIGPNWTPFFEWVNHYIPTTPPTKMPAQNSSTVPAPRGDANSMIAHEQLVAKALAGRIDLYFLGDSITRRWGCSDPQWKEFHQHWKQNFHGWNAANFGWGGDRIENIHWRILNGELSSANPKVIVLLAGTNNIGAESADDQKIDDIVRGIDALLKTCREKAPNATIILMGIFPRNDSMEAMPAINRINEQLATRADGKTIRFLNINDKLADASGRLRKGVTIDQLHLSLSGYEIWADALRPLLTELLGPRNSEDFAPPATGDPSAQ